MKFLYIVISLSLLWNVAEYALFFLETIIFHDEPWYKHTKHEYIAIALTFINIALAIIYHLVFE